MGTWGGPVGSSTASQLMGGNNGPGVITNVENFDSSTTAVTAAAWASGPSRQNTLTDGAGADGTPSAWLVWSGRGAPGTPPFTSNVSEEFNGSAFSNTPNLNKLAKNLYFIVAPDHCDIFNSSSGND